MRKITAALLSVVCFLFLPFLSACAETSARVSSSADVAFEPVFRENRFSSEPEQLDGGIEVDSTTASEGYIGVKLLNENRVKAIVSCGETSFTYELQCDGSVNYLPVQCGEGDYRLQVLQNTVETRYIEIAALDFTVEKADEFSPFLHSNVYVPYTRDSEVVRLAEQLSQESESELEFFKAVYNYVKENISYDYELAATVKSGYMPDPDRTLELKKGICLDYASLTAAMLRSQGIPARLVTGYVGEDGLYHAWNVVYLQETGWVAVELSISGSGWNRIDITFAAAGGKESIYVDRYLF